MWCFYLSQARWLVSQDVIRDISQLKAAKGAPLYCLVNSPTFILSFTISLFIVHVNSMLLFANLLMNHLNSSLFSTTENDT